LVLYRRRKIGAEAFAAESGFKRTDIRPILIASWWMLGARVVIFIVARELFHVGNDTGAMLVAIASFVGMGIWAIRNE